MAGARCRAPVAHLGVGPSRNNMKTTLYSFTLALGIGFLTSCASHGPTPAQTSANPVFGECAEILVVGEVRRPGSLVVARDATFHQVLCAAGGFTDKAVRDRLKITRPMDDADLKVPEDLPAANGGRRNVGFIVDPAKPQWSPLPWTTGDVLYVSSLGDQ